MGENAQRNNASSPINTGQMHSQQQQQLQQQHHREASTSSARKSLASRLSTITGEADEEHYETRENLCKDDVQELQEIRNLLWGPSIRADVFQRWSQGFEFSDCEPSALVQKQGGPCAVIAPVQAFLLKILIMDTPGHCLKDVTEEKCKRLLIQALCTILSKCNSNRYRIVYLPLDSCAEAKESLANANEPLAELNENEEASNVACMEPSTPEAAALSDNADEFHQRLQVLHFASIDEVDRYYTENYNVLSAQYGVLLFMYTVLLTKGIDRVNQELSDTSEPLIHNTYGYGGQALINLMLTGKAVAHVWDNEVDVGGLKLQGISEQSDIGFITLMEQMRYCTVGSFFKNPKNPVWVMGSETHLTVLFSTEKKLVSPETPSEIARRVFKSYDPEGNNFIPTSLLQDVLASLELVSVPEYVEIMQKRLDPEGLGIILLNAFMDEFFAEETNSMPDTFDLMHYNGIPGSNEGNKVRYTKGSAILLESDLRSMCSSNPMMTCLQTKWPNIEINWHDMRVPSLN